MRRERLVWMAVGAGLVSVAMLVAQVWAYHSEDEQDERYLYISVHMDPVEQDLAITAVGECVGDFGVSMPADGFLIVLPLQSLEARDFACLIDRLGPVRHSMDIRSEAHA